MSAPDSPSARFAGLAFVGPFVGLYTFLLIVPLIMGIVLSFHQADLFGARRWIGVENYLRLAADPVFQSALGNTLLLTMMTVQC
jgi:ABC-type sugar transport system permease subunit